MPMMGPGSMGSSNTLRTVPSSWNATSQVRPLSSMGASRKMATV